MTLPSETTKVQYDGTGSTTEFPVTFVFWTNSDLRIIHRDSSQVETVWVEDTQYTLTGGAGSTGGLTVKTSPTDYTPAAGETLTIKSNLANTQDTDLPSGGAFPSGAVEQELDQMARRIQQLEETIGRAFFAPETDAGTTYVVPNETDRASKFAAYDSNGDPIASTGPTGDSTIPVTTFVETLLDDTTAGNFRTTLGLGTFAVANTNAVPAQTLAGTINGADNEINRVNFKDYGEIVKVHGNLNSATNASFEDGNVHSFTVTGSFTLTLTNPPASGKAGSITFEITNGGAFTLTWDPQIIWAGGNAPSLTASGPDTVTVYTTNAGSTIYGFAAGLDFS